MAVVFESTNYEKGTTIEGVLDWEDDCLVVEFERPRLFRAAEIVRVEIPLEDIDYVDFKPFVFNARLMVRMLYLETAKRVDWAKGLDIKFVVPKREWERAQHIVDEIDKAIDAEAAED